MHKLRAVMEAVGGERWVREGGQGGRWRAKMDDSSLQFKLSPMSHKIYCCLDFDKLAYASMAATH